MWNICLRLCIHIASKHWNILTGMVCNDHNQLNSVISARFPISVLECT